MVLRAPAAFESIINTTLDQFGLLKSSDKSGGTSIEIRQLEGASPKTIVIRDRSMPYQEPTFGVQLKTKKTNYPGNPVATQQVLYPDATNTTLEGMWKDRFIRGSVLVDDDDTVVTSADEATGLFESLILAAKLVRVQWLSFVRVGLLVRFDVKPQNSRDVKWELEFEWQSREETKGRRTSPLENPKPDDLLNLYNTISDIVALAPGIVSSFIAVAVSAIRDIGDTLGTVVDLLRAVESIVSIPAQLWGAIRAAVLSLVRQVQELTRKLSDSWTQSFMGQGAALALATANRAASEGREHGGAQTSALTSQASYGAWSRSLSLSLSALSFNSQRALDGVSERVVPATLRTVTVGEGETLYTLSAKFYGSPDFANFLATSNGLTSVRVPPGFRLRVPSRPFGSLGAVEMSGGKQSGAAGSL